MAKKSRRVAPKEFISKTGVTIIGNVYCRRCMDTKPPIQFYQYVDQQLDKNGLMSVCKECCTEIFDENYASERTMSKAFLKTCRTLNIVYDVSVVDSVLQEIKKAEDKNKKPKAPFGTYRTRITLMISRTNKIEDESGHDLTFKESISSSPVDTNENLEMMSHDEFWGTGYDTEQIEFLETEYQEFKKNFSTEGHATVVLLKMACKKLLLMHEEEQKESGGSTTALEKSLMTIMKELAISPAHQRAADTDRSGDSLGNWIADIEKYTPAQWLKEKGKELHHDVDNVDYYYQNYVARPVKNFILGNPDYTIEDGEESSDG